MPSITRVGHAPTLDVPSTPVVHPRTKRTSYEPDTFLQTVFHQTAIPQNGDWLSPVAAYRDMTNAAHVRLVGQSLRRWSECDERALAAKLATLSCEPPAAGSRKQLLANIAAFLAQKPAPRIA